MVLIIHLRYYFYQEENKMQDGLNRCLILLTLDNSVLNQHKDKVEEIFHNVDSSEIVDVLLLKNGYDKEINYKAVRKTIPLMVQNLINRDKSISEETVGLIYDRWRLKKVVIFQDCEILSQALIEADIDHVYVNNQKIYQVAYPHLWADRVTSNVNILVRDSTIDAAYEQLTHSFELFPACDEQGAREFIKQYASNYIPLRGKENICTLNHKFCSPRMGFCKINIYVQEVFSRAVEERTTGIVMKYLSPEDQLLYLFSEMYYQQMYENRYTPQHYSDIVGYIYNSDVNWSKLINYSNRYDANRILYYCILFINTIHQFLFSEDLFDQSLLSSIPVGMINHLYECRNGALFSDDVIGYHDSAPHELLFGYRHDTVSFGDLSSHYHSMKKEEKRKTMDKLVACGVFDYNYDTYGDITIRKEYI